MLAFAVVMLGLFVLVIGGAFVIAEMTGIDDEFWDDYD